MGEKGIQPFLPTIHFFFTHFSIPREWVSAAARLQSASRLISPLRQVKKGVEIFPLFYPFSSTTTSPCWGIYTLHYVRRDLNSRSGKSISFSIRTEIPDEDRTWSWMSSRMNEFGEKRMEKLFFLSRTQIPIHRVKCNAIKIEEECHTYRTSSSIFRGMSRLSVKSWVLFPVFCHQCIHRSLHFFPNPSKAASNDGRHVEWKKANSC